MTENRHNFTKAIADKIAKRAGWLCSFPSCRASTVGATANRKGEINIGTAAHICAAAPGGPRFDENMSKEERSSAENGIWMCRDHGKAIDSDIDQFPAPLLREWKRQAELESCRRVLRNIDTPASANATSIRTVERLRHAAEEDLKVFRRTAKWPSTDIALRLEVQDFDAPVATDALARAVVSLDDLILVAGPGMGKTTTLFQISEGLLKSAENVPIIVLLNDWATENVTILDSILKRPAFKGISEDEFRASISQPGVVLLLDGWNELDVTARNRARAQVSRLKAELPELGLIVSTRKPRNQALDVPFSGTRVDLLPLSEDQQMAIATAMKGDEGVQLVDQAWRTAGVRELVTIPFYLTALLSLPKGAPFPSTKEQVIRSFVSAQEKEIGHADSLYSVVQGHQQEYLEALAAFATRTANTSISDHNALRSISDTAHALTRDGLIATKPEPNVILDKLIGNHVLMRAGDAAGISFQHQQFQEWYASHTVENEILNKVNSPMECQTLKGEIFNFPVWEEAILFAIERMSRSDAYQQAACGQAILAALEVDPILAAEMIFRATEEVWARVSVPVQDFVGRWHIPRKNDRAFRFMLMSGRPEFLDAVWPLISNSDDQISLSALRNCKRFRPSILGKNATEIILALPEGSRSTLLREIAARSAMDGLDLATSIASCDPSPEIKLSVIEELSFRRADRHTATILRDADEKTFELVARKGLIDRIDDENVRQGIKAARERLAATETSAADRIWLIAYREEREDCSAELTEIISTIGLDKKRDIIEPVIHKAYSRYPRAVADGLLARVRAGTELIFGTDDMLLSVNYVIEDNDLLDLAMESPAVSGLRADAATTVLGPKSAGRLIDTLLELAPRMRTEPAASKAYGELERRLAYLPRESLTKAISERSAKLSNEQMSLLASLLSRCFGSTGSHRRPFNNDTVRIVQDLAESWGRRMLASTEATRWQKANIVRLIEHVPSVRFVSLLKEMLDDNLHRWRAFRAEAEATRWQPSEAVNEARSPGTWEYQRAFAAINAPEVFALMQQYLENKNFAPEAARVLEHRWRMANDPPKDGWFPQGIDWSNFQKRRAARLKDPATTCQEAEAIFAAISPLVRDGATEQQKNLAIELGIIALRLPHGQRDSVIRELLALAPNSPPMAIRSDLLLSLVLSGEEIDITAVAAGIDATLEAARTRDWILTEGDGRALMIWLRLLPFVSNPIDGLAVLLRLPARWREVYFLRDLVRIYAFTHPDATEQVLFGLAEANPEFYRNHEWQSVVLALETRSAMRRLVDRIAEGALNDRTGNTWHLIRQVSTLFDTNTELRQHVYSLLEGGARTPGLEMLAGAVAENPDEEGLLLLVKLEEQGKRFRSIHMIEKVVTEHVPVAGYKDTYNIVPVQQVELRRKLFSMTTDGGPSDVSARWLRNIDSIRDEYGFPDDEPRHPDLASGKAWPLLPRGQSIRNGG